MLSFIFKWLKRIGLSFLSLIALYGLAVLAGAFIKTGSVPDQDAEAVEIYLVNNSFHSAFLVPVRHPLFNWESVLPTDLPIIASNHALMEIGWGDADFYQADGTPSLYVTLKAFLLPSPSVIAIAFLGDFKPDSEPGVKKLKLTDTQYKKLCDYILSTAELGEEGRMISTSRKVSKNIGFFFHAKGDYHLFNTCNNWTGRALQTMEIRTGIWTPLALGVGD